MKAPEINYKELGKKIAKEALGNLPGGGFIVPFIELIENLVSQDQLEAAIQWVQESKATAISGERPIKQQDVKHSLEEQFKATPAENSSYAFYYPYSFISGGKLIQFKEESSDKHIVDRDTKYYGEFAPIEKTNTLSILIADKYEQGLSEGPFYGDEQKILVPKEDAKILVITFEQSKLSSPIVNFFDRQSVSLELRTGRSDRQEPTQLTDWDNISSLLLTNIPSLELER
ncbi:MAG: hypothetical protein WCG44_02310 [bacterium]